MGKIKKTISTVLVTALLFAVAAISPVQAAVEDSEKTGGGGYSELYLDPGDAYMENTKWYAWTWWDSQGWSYEDGDWMNGIWTKNDKGEDVVMFDMLLPNVVFVCVPDSVEFLPSWNDVIYQSPETEVPYDGYVYKVTSVNDTDKPNLTGEWIWSDDSDDPYVAGDVSHNSFGVLNPVSTGTYYVNQRIDVAVAVSRYYYSYSANGSRLSRPNCVVLEFKKNNRVVDTMSFQYQAEDIGHILTKTFYPKVTGTYTVRVGFEKQSAYSITDDNYVGQYTFRVLTDEVTPNTKIGDINGDSAIDVLDALMIHKYAVDKIDLSDEEKYLADVNNDNVVDILDALDIQKFAVDKLSEFEKKV